MLYLVKCTVQVSEYMMNTPESMERIHIVEADNEEQAQLLVICEWEDRSVYVCGNSYYVTIEYVNPLLACGDMK